MLAFSVACLVVAVTPTTVEFSAGPNIGIAPQIGVGRLMVAGAGLGSMVSFGNEFYVSLNSELVLTPIGLDGRSASYSDFLLRMPVAEAALDAGFRFYDDDVVRVGAGLGIGGAMVPFSCGDCYGNAFGLGVTPHVAVTWKITPWLDC